MYNICFVCADNKKSKTASIFSRIMENYQKTDEVSATCIGLRNAADCLDIIRRSNLIIAAGVSAPDAGLLEALRAADGAYIVLNADDKGCRSFATTCGVPGRSGVKPLTYGFSNKATLTASSINRGGGVLSMQLCLQRALVTLAGTKLAPYEFAFNTLNGGSADIYAELAAVTAALSLGVDFDKSEKILF